MKNITQIFQQKRLVFITGTITLILAVAISAYFFFQYKKNQKPQGNVAGTSAVETKTLIENVAKLIMLPSDETPTIATVADSERLKNQPFFTNAKNGDKVLIYQNAKKAILYDPVGNKIIEVAPINVGTPSAQTTATVTPAPLKIALYNGTNTPKLTNTVEKDIKTKMPEIEVVEKANAKKQDYEKTVVVDLTGTRQSQAQQIATLLNGDVGKLPTEEALPSASGSAQIDILAIIGKNYVK